MYSPSPYNRIILISIYYCQIIVEIKKPNKGKRNLRQILGLSPTDETYRLGIANKEIEEYTNINLDLSIRLKGVFCVV